MGALWAAGLPQSVPSQHNVSTVLPWGRIYGLIIIASGMCAAAGAYLGGWLYELSGHYRYGAMLSMGMFLIGNLPFWLIPRLTRWKPDSFTL